MLLLVPHNVKLSLIFSQNKAWSFHEEGDGASIGLLNIQLTLIEERFKQSSLLFKDQFYTH